MTEFELIAEYFKPLTKGVDGVFGLADDAAFLDVPSGNKLVVAKDMLQEGVHFIGDEPAATIAHKLLAVNLSDMAAMGATPYAYMLGIGLPKRCGQDWVTDFAKGLEQVQNQYGFYLLGGDSTSTQEHISLSISMFGLAKNGTALRRNGAVEGDAIYVSGAIGDGWLGLQLMQDKLNGVEHLSANKRVYLQECYQQPTPRIALGEMLAKSGAVTSCMDVSDGLLQDISQIAKASNVGVGVDLSTIPLSDVAQILLEHSSIKLTDLLSGGDDYQLLFTVAQENETQILSNLPHDINITRIGVVTHLDNGMVLRDGTVKTLFSELETQGWKHSF